MGAMALLSGLLLLAPAALACGGGGSGGYRKPVRPDHFNQTSTKPSNATASEPVAPGSPEIRSGR